MKVSYKLHWKTRLLDLLLKSAKPLEQMNRDELKSTAQQPVSPLMQRIFAGKKIDISRVVEQNVSGRHGEIPVRLYYPSKSQHLPLIVYFHGGGWVYGNFDTHDYLYRRLARDANSIVMAINYRLAPFYQYPTALEDCFDGLVWAVNNLGEAIDSERITVMGDSAGGNLATALCLMSRDFAISKQVLLYPVLSGKLTQPSTRENSDAPVLTTERMQFFVDCYAKDDSDIESALFSPLFAEDMSNLPSTLIITAQYDPLHDQAVEYAQRLKDAGVAVKLLDYPHTIHGFISFPTFCPDALPALAEVVRFVRK